MSLVAEQMNFFEKKEKQEGMISKVIKGAFSIMFVLSALTYALGLDKVGKTGKRHARRH